MKYQLVYGPDRNSLTIHVNQRLSDKVFERWESEEGHYNSPTPALAREMFGVDGVVVVSVARYNFQMCKGEIFEWDNITPQLLTIIKRYYAPEAEFIEAKPARYERMDSRGFIFEEQLEDVIVEEGPGAEENIQ